MPNGTEEITVNVQMDDIESAKRFAELIPQIQYCMQCLDHVSICAYVVLFVVASVPPIVPVSDIASNILSWHIAI